MEQEDTNNNDKEKPQFQLVNSKMKTVAVGVASNLRRHTLHLCSLGG
jgi:hypothetical protein